MSQHTKLQLTLTQPCDDFNGVCVWILPLNKRSKIHIGAGNWTHYAQAFPGYYKLS